MTLLDRIPRWFGVLLLLLPLGTQAQTEYATIRKNVNVLAKGLKHDLNRSKDTLILRSNDSIYRVYTVGERSGEIDLLVNGHQKDINLRQLDQGKYVFVVDQHKLKIVFQVFINDVRTGVVSPREFTELPSPGMPSESAQKTETSLLTSSETSLRVPAVKLSESRIENVEAVAVKDSDIDPVSLKAYNLTDIDRRNMQSRDDARRLNDDRVIVAKKSLDKRYE